MRFVALSLAALLSATGCRVREPLPPPASPLSATADEEFRRNPPSPPSFSTFTAPTVEVVSLANGLTVMLLRREASPVTTVRVVNRGGGENGPAERAGWSWLIGELITDDLSGAGAEALTGLPVIPSVEVRRDSASVSVTVPRTHLSGAIVELGRAIQTQSFSSEEVTDARVESLAWLRGEWIAHRNLGFQARRLLYGEEHRFAIPLRGSIDTLEDLSSNEIQTHYQATWQPADCALIIVGNVELESVREMVEMSWGGWTVESVPLSTSEVSEPVHEEEFRTLALQHLRSPSSILLLERAPDLGNTDFLPFTLIAHMLGRMSSARLQRTMRETHGAPGGVEVSYRPGATTGELTIESSLATARVGPALRSIVDEMRRLSREGPGSAELETARAMARERFVATFEEGPAAAELLGELFVVGISPDQLASREERFRTITAAEVRHVAREWLRHDRAPFVVTGELSTLSSSISAAGVGRAVYRR